MGDKEADNNGILEVRFLRGKPIRGYSYPIWVLRNIAIEFDRAGYLHKKRICEA